MSESEVSQIRDEDVLRRMWQQTEDFSRKKEIRAHMYRLREERLRNLYSPEPTPGGKGCEFTSAQGHVKSFADQNFQSMKSKEVRDAGSPPKEFAYRGQDLKELSNAGWNVESEDRTTDDGRTHVKSVNANIEGRYDVEGGRGEFAAVDRQRQAVTEHHDDHSSMRRDETSSATAAHEHVQRQTDDGTRFSSTTSSSNTSSKVQQVSSTKHETVPYVTDDDYDLARRTAHDTNRNEHVTRTTNRNDSEQTLRKNDFTSAELVSRKIEYPDDNTKVIVETRCLPDGTQVTSTRREFRVPAQSTRSEYQTRSESKSYSSQHKSDTKDSTIKTTRHTIDNRSNDIVDSQKNVDDYDFKRQIREYTDKENDDYSNAQQRYVTKTDRKVTDYSQTDDDYSQKHYETRTNSKVVDHSTTNKEDHSQSQRRTFDRRIDNQDEVDRHHITTIRDHDIQHKVVNESHHINDTKEKMYNITKERKDTEEKRHIIRGRTDIEDSVRNMSKDRATPLEKVRDSPWDDAVPAGNDRDTYNPRDGTVPVERVRDIPRDSRATVDSFRHIPRDGTAPTERTCDITRDRTVPVEKVFDIPRGSTVPEESVPRDRTVPVERARDVPRDSTASVDRVRDIPRDGTVPEDRTRGIPRDRTIVDERVYTVTKDTKVDEKVERKTSNEHYQTTYQNDYQTRKISTDWSPTHQAWASTLRSDTPSTTRPSTRASSPGSKTFKSSTSSLRSSVSPDKSFRKPSSRGGSPNKVDRYSPTRTVSSDRYSSTHSTHSVTELRTNKNTSPERKPPTGRSSDTSGYSPDRKPQDLHRQRPSASPEKKPKSFTERPSSSPERKPSRKSTPTDEHRRSTSPLGKKDSPKSPKRPRQSPERKPIYQPSDENHSDTYSRTSPDKKPTDGYLNRSSPRSSPSPDRKPGNQKPTDLSGNPRTSSPSRPRYPTDHALPKSGTSPDRKPSSQRPSVQPEPSSDKSFDKCPQDLTKKRPSLSPDRKPSYMRPTAASHPEDKIRRPSKSGDEPNRKSPTKQVPAQTPDRKPQDLSKNTTIKEDHYRFVDEETKVYTDETNITQKVTKSSPTDESCPRDKSPSPIGKTPIADSPDFHKAPFKKAKSPSPLRDSVTITENDELYGRIKKTVETIDITSKEDKHTEDITTVKRTPKSSEYPADKGVPSRETSPSKYGTYDKKKPRDVVNTTEVTTITTENTKDVKYDSVTPKDKISPKNVPDVPSSPRRKSSKDNASPSKSPAKDTKYKHTTEFLATERTTEEINKKTTAKDRPRQLVTPSSSPTRKPNITETEPSTGQSSPTTSVSGFVYFGSPRAEKPMVTDLDEFYPDSGNPEEITKRPESLDVKRSSSPSKIPCRSPSPEKHVPTIKENLPRKSSLKKPSTNINQVSPIEKPPTSFRVSPTDDKPEVPEHKMVKKDRAGEPEIGEPETGEPGSTFKPKPPLQRRETYEDRCKKILGMADNTTTDSVTKETRRYTKKPDSSQSSPSVSPCDSPAPKESSTFPNYPGITKTTNTKVDVTEFITREQEDHIKTTIACDDKKNKVPSRESSPTKLQDIKKTTLITDKTTKDELGETTTTKTVKTKYPSPKQSRNQPLSQPSDETEYKTFPNKKIIDDSPRDAYQKRPSESPERKPTSSPSKPSLPRDNTPSRLNLSPERKVVEKYQKEFSPSRTGQENVYKQTTTSETSEYDTMTTTGNVEETSKITKITNKSQPTRILESPTRQTPKSNKSLPNQSEHPRTTSPSRPQPKEGSPARKTVSHDRPTDSDHSKDMKTENTRPGDVRRSRPRESTERSPNYMKSTTAITSKYDSTYTAEDKDETYTIRVRQKNEPQNKTTPSPTRQTPQSASKAGSPTKPSPPSDSSLQRPDSSPQRKPSKDVHEKKPSDEELKDSRTNRPHEVPGYMKSTKAVTTKFDTTTNSDNVQETTNTKTVERKHTSVAKSTRPSEISPDRKPRTPQQLSSPDKESPTKKPETKHTTVLSPTRPGSEKVPGYMKTTASIKSKHETTDYDSTVIDDTQKKTTTTTERKYSASSKSESPTRRTPKSNDESAPEYLRTTSPSRPLHQTFNAPDSYPELKPGYQQPAKDSPTRKPVDTHPQPPSSTSSEKPHSYLKTTITAISNNDTISTTEEIEENINRKNVHRKYHSDIPAQGSPDTSNRPRTLSPLKPTDKLPRTSTTSPERKPSSRSPINDNTLAENKNTKYTTPKRSNVSPERPNYMKATASMTSKIDTNIATHDTQETFVSVVERRSPSPRASVSPTRHSPEREPRENLGYLSKPEERQLRTPSPIKKTTKVTEANTDFLMSEREQEILNKVQKSLRKLSPERKDRSPSRERSPTKTTTSLLDLDIVTTETIETRHITNEDSSEIIEEPVTTTQKIISPRQPKEDKHNATPYKPSSRNVSPTKRVPSISSANKVDRSPESPTKSRSFSPKKPVSQAERPQSPQVPKISGIKPREQIPTHLTRKPTPATLSTTKIERLTTDIKKTNNITKQNVYAKSSTTKTTNRSIPSPTSKASEPDSKRTPTLKGVKDNTSPKKDAVTRTVSDIAMKPKKTSSPQRMKSKPEIQVSDMSTRATKSQKPLINEPHSKLPNKPKSATALNTSIDEDDIIIDVQQSKSSRENSPDRICPTPVNFSDDIGIPRFPDEVSEPDDELVKRTYHTIHETESVVDDIVEICEDEELFVKKSGMDVITEHDDSLLSVNDKVNKFTSRIRSVSKPKDSTTTFKDTEKRAHSDFIDDNLKSDECLLTVSEKVNKFAKGPRDTKDSRSPSRKITDEYDRDTVYQDDYTKLSVNDKAHLFVETAENVKVTKIKPTQKVDRPDLSHVDESLKTDDCLLSVSDKVNKFVKTAEQYITETHEIEDTEKKIKEQHDKIIRQIVDDDEEDIYDINEPSYTQETIDDKPISRPEDRSKTRSKEPQTSHQRLKDYGSPNTKPTERVPVVKITTLRSSEAVKKAKALFENIASTQKTTQKETTQTAKTIKLTDIGVIKKSPITDSTTVLHSSIEDLSLHVTDAECEVDVSNTKKRPSSGSLSKPQYSRVDEKPRSSPNRLIAQSPEAPRSKSPMRQSVEVTTAKTVLSRYPASTRAESPKQRPESPRQRTESPRQRPESEKPDKVPGYLRPTKTSQIKEETKVIEETEVSSRRGSGKFGVELRRTSVERSTLSSERRRSVEHHQPCIEDIFDLDLLEQMLEKVTGYEQRRRIRTQIRITKAQSEHEVDSNTYTRTTKQTTTVSKTRSPERRMTKSPEKTHKSTPQKTSSPDRHNKSTPQKTISDRTQPKEPTMNGHTKETTRTVTVTRQRPHSPEKPAPKATLAPRTPSRQPSPDKRRTTSPSKTTPKPKGNRFNEYASAYMKKVGLNESDKVKFTDAKTKKTTESKQTVKHEKQQATIQEFTTTRSFTERTSSKDVIEVVQTNGKRSPSPQQRQSPERKVQFPEHNTLVLERKAQSPERKAQSPVRKAQSPVRKAPSPERKAQSPERKAQSPVRKAQSPERKGQSPDLRAYSPERKAQSPERLHQRTPSPDFKRPKADTVKETIIKTVHDIEKKVPAKPVQEDKPSWVTNRNLKKTTSETRTYSSKKIENEKPKYRATSPSKVISKPLDVITSSYGPGPLDADGKPLFGIKALRNGASNFQVKGTVIRQEFHSRNGGEPEGTVSVTAYSSQPEELEELLASQGAEPPSRIHGLAAITTTKKFGGDTGNTLSNIHTKEDRASLEHFTHHDRRVDNRESRTYETRSQEFSGDTRREQISGNTRRIESKKDDHQTDRNDRSTRREEKVTETKRGKVEERREKVERREDKKTVRQSSVKSLTEKYIKSANDSGKADRSTYPKAGLILRTTTMRDSVSSDDAHPGLTRTDSEHSLGSVDDTVVTTERSSDGMRTTTTRTTHHHGPTVTTHTRGSTVITHHEPVITSKKTSTVITQEPVITHRVITQDPVITHRVISHEPVVKVTQGRQGSTVTTERSFLDSNTKVTGVQDILTRMKNADIVIQEGDSSEDREARALLNKFLGASVLMAGMQGYVTEDGRPGSQRTQETVRSSSSSGEKVTSRTVEELDLDQCWDERLLKQLLDECTDYEQRRRLRARIRTLMAEQEACASAVTEALGAAGASDADGGDGSEAREEEEVTVTSSVRRDSSDRTVSSSTSTKTSKVIEMTRPAPKPVSPFAKFRQLEKQNSINSPNSPKTPQSPGSPAQPYFKFTDPALQASALTIKERLLQWCRDKTRDYENVKLENFSTSWADGLAFCALVHHFLPDAFDYSKLTADKRRHNFTLAFKVADEKAGIYPLLDVDDMVAMRKPDWKCVFTYVQAIYRRFKDE